jgi:hypothetical protein
MLGAIRDARKLLSFAEAAERWGVSAFTVRRLADQNLISTVNIASRRLVPIEEALRIEAEGVGKARPRKIKAAV